MSKERIVFVGDYDKKEDRSFLGLFVKKYAGEYDVFVTGYSIKRIRECAIEKNVALGGMNSKIHSYYKHTASYIVITSPAVHYHKEKTNQKIIYCLQSSDMDAFGGVISTIDTVITDSPIIKEYFNEKGINTSTILISSKDEEKFEEACLKELPISDRGSKNPISLVYVSGEMNPQYPTDGTASKALFEELKNDSANSIITISDTLRDNSFTSFFSLKPSKALEGFLEYFDGTILFDSDASRSVFLSLLEENNYKANKASLSMLERVNIIYLDYLYGKFKNNLTEGRNSSNIYSEYKELLNIAYEKNNCETIKVSVIICRYNTPTELLYRAISSALNAGHSNVEIVIIDDGSEKNIEKELYETFPNDNIVYYYKDNEGLGLSRNYALKKVTGEYIYYLDSDDEIHPEGLKYLVSHAAIFDLDMVSGKRVLVDEYKRPISESINYLGENTFQIYQKDRPSSIYRDIMVNNKLIRKQALIDNQIFFSPGLYEDIEYSAKLYSRIREYHFINFFVHDWYQYGTNSTISSSISIRNYRERLAKENERWKYIPEKSRKDYFQMLLKVSFTNYLESFDAYNGNEQYEIWETLQEFFLEKMEYYEKRDNIERESAFIKTLLLSDFDCFKRIVDEYYSCGVKQTGGHTNFIALTHYHLYVSCLYALRNNNGNNRLFLSTSYIKFSNKMVHALKRTGLFEDIITFSGAFNLENMFDEIDKRPDEADIIIANTFYPYFQGVFKKCNYEQDQTYFFSDTQPYWLFVERKFKNLIKLEDAYNSFDREVKTFELYGKWANIKKYEGKGFPLMFFRSPQIKQIIISSRLNTIPEFYSNKIRVIDTKELLESYKEAMRNICIEVYGIEASAFHKDSVLLLTQPLALFGYCTKKEQQNLYKRICEQYNKDRLLIKPHPGDAMDYSYLGGTVLKRNIPIEIYNLANIEIAETISFGSSASETITFAKENTTLFRMHDFTKEDVENAIHEIVYADDKIERKTTNKGSKKAKRIIKACVKRLVGIHR